MKKKRMVAIATAITMFTYGLLTGCSSSGSGEGQESQDTASQEEQVEQVDTLARAQINKLIASTDESYEKYAKSIMDEMSENYCNDASGFRTAGSDAELAAADRIVEIYEEIGLETEKVPVTIDKWQFNDATLTMTYQGENGEEEINLTNKDKEIASYATSGTVQSSRNTDWNNLEIVNVGDGTMHGYDKARKGNEDEDFFNNKIVMAGLNQEDEYWISNIYNEAHAQGAAGLITYQKTIKNFEEASGDGMFNPGESIEDWDTVIVQDLETFDFDIPCIAISPRDAHKIKKALKQNAKNSDKAAKVKLYVDNEVVKSQTAYNVVATIKGTGNTGQRFLFDAHYDKYAAGFQDNSSAVGLSAAIAKAIVDADIKPYNDIVFISSCAEEWGQIDAEFVWAMGAWKLMHEAKHDEWSTSTLGGITYEEVAGPFGDETYLYGTHETEGIMKNFVKDDLLSEYEGNVKPAITTVTGAEGSAECNMVCYQLNGVPSYCPGSGELDIIAGENSTEHTKYDDDRTYDADSVAYKIIQDAAIALYVDSTPANVLDFGKRAAVLEEAMPEGDAEDKAEAYTQAVKDLRTAGKKLKAKGKQINADFQQAYENGDEEAMENLRKKAVEYNKTSLEAFLLGQEKFICLNSWYGIQPRQQSIGENIKIINKVLKQVDNGKYAKAAMTAGTLWSSNEYQVFDFSRENYETKLDAYNSVSLKKRNETNWATKDISPMLDSYEATALLGQIAYELIDANEENVNGVKEAYNDVLGQLNTLYVEAVDQSIDGMNDVTECINAGL